MATAAFAEGDTARLALTSGSDWRGFRVMGGGSGIFEA